jgi:hypothetical protein
VQGNDVSRAIARGKLAGHQSKGGFVSEWQTESQEGQDDEQEQQGGESGSGSEGGEESGGSEGGGEESGADGQ